MKRYSAMRQTIVNLLIYFQIPNWDECIEVMQFPAKFHIEESSEFSLF